MNLDIIDKLVGAMEREGLGAMYGAVAGRYPNAERRLLDLKGKRSAVEAFLIRLN
jgi:hypothetical protein